MARLDSKSEFVIDINNAISNKNSEHTGRINDFVNSINNINNSITNFSLTNYTLNKKIENVGDFIEEEKFCLVNNIKEIYGTPVDIIQLSDDTFFVISKSMQLYAQKITVSNEIVSVSEKVQVTTNSCTNAKCLKINNSTVAIFFIESSSSNTIKARICKEESSSLSLEDVITVTTGKYFYPIIDTNGYIKLFHSYTSLQLAYTPLLYTDKLEKQSETQILNTVENSGIIIHVGQIESSTSYQNMPVLIFTRTTEDNGHNARVACVETNNFLQPILTNTYDINFDSNHNTGSSANTIPLPNGDTFVVITSQTRVSAFIIKENNGILTFPKATEIVNTPYSYEIEYKPFFINNKIGLFYPDDANESYKNLMLLQCSYDGTFTREKQKIDDGIAGSFYYASHIRLCPFNNSLLLCTGDKKIHLYKKKKTIIGIAKSTGNVGDTIQILKAHKRSVYEIDNSFNKIYLEQGIYKLEVWGASGGDYSTSVQGGRGGYSTGILKLNNETQIIATAGGNPTSTFGGSNGGGAGRTNGKGGGGASDISIGSSDYARVIVAGGGGGAGVSASANLYGYGGGLTGQDGYSSSNRNGYGGTQTAGGQCWNNVTAHCGSFATGGSATTGYSVGGGGGGWYGGGAGYDSDSDADGRNGGGGSGYVYTEETASNYPQGCLLNSSHYLTNARTIAGNETFLSPTGEEEIGHTGNGFVRITRIG